MSNLIFIGKHHISTDVPSTLIEKFTVLFSPNQSLN